jgi:hypothetical protein
MAQLPDHDSCKKCGDDLFGFVRAIGVCGRCMQMPPLPTSVPRPTYTLYTPRAVKERVWQRP